MSERERWAYEELRPGDVIQEGDEWQNPDGHWHALMLIPGASTQVRDDIRARRPHNITRLQTERDEARAEVKQLQAERQEFSARLEAEITAAALVIDELTAAKDALKSAQRARDELQLQVDELRADRSHLQRLVDDLLDEPTAKRVYKMLEDMLDQTEWVGQCLDSSTYEQMSCIQRTISVIGERVRDMVKEGTSANA